ncbi:lipoyl synthase LipA [Escherichia coli]|uniref:Lipoyl synthase LipA n=1 Tax=Escherichia coli TaxID=562 RepID=A0A3S4L6Y7_ECOLX|nr:lipoyl synthase LipA [Escherichia coli]
MSKPIVMERGVKYRDADKMALIPVKNVATEREALLRKPEWDENQASSGLYTYPGHQSRNAQKWPAFCLRGSLLP